MPARIANERPISLCHLTILDADAVELIEAATYSNISSVSMRVIPRDRFDPTQSLINEPLAVKKIQTSLRSCGVSVLEIEASWLTPEFDLDTLERALALGSLFGSRYLLAIGFDPERGRLEENLRRAYELAEKYHHRLMLEFIPYSSVISLDDAHSLLSRANAVNAGIVVDALHLIRSGGSPEDLKKYDQSLFPYFQICDAPLFAPPSYALREEARERRLSPGDGDLWLKEFIEYFTPEATLCIEVPNKFHHALAPRERVQLYAAAARQLISKD